MDTRCTRERERERSCTLSRWENHHRSNTNPFVTNQCIKGIKNSPYGWQKGNSSTSAIISNWRWWWPSRSTNWRWKSIMMMMIMMMMHIYMYSTSWQNTPGRREGLWAPEKQLASACGWAPAPASIGAYTSSAVQQWGSFQLPSPGMRWYSSPWLAPELPAGTSSLSPPPISHLHSPRISSPPPCRPAPAPSPFLSPFLYPYPYPSPCGTGNDPCRARADPGGISTTRDADPCLRTRSSSWTPALPYPCSMASPPASSRGTSAAAAAALLRLSPSPSAGASAFLHALLRSRSLLPPSACNSHRCHLLSSWSETETSLFLFLALLYLFLFSNSHRALARDHAPPPCTRACSYRNSQTNCPAALPLHVGVLPRPLESTSGSASGRCLFRCFAPSLRYQFPLRYWWVPSTAQGFRLPKLGSPEELHSSGLAMAMEEFAAIFALNWSEAIIADQRSPGRCVDSSPPPTAGHRPRWTQWLPLSGGRRPALRTVAIE